MYEKTQQQILKNLQEGTFAGAVYQWIEPTKKETKVLGNAAVLPALEAMTAEHLFDVASLTKVVCTTSIVLRLWEQGQLSFEDPLKKHLPQFENHAITLRHLLTHTSDIQTWIANREQLDADALRQAYLTLQPGANLGKVVKYTDTGTILLGFMLEELFGLSAVEIFQQEVLTPLRMFDSQFPPISSPVIVPTEQLKGKLLKGETHDPKARILGKHAGNAGLFTTISDLSKFVESFFSATYLKPETIQMLLADQTPNGKGKRSLGWDLKGDMLFHTGYTGTFLLIHPLKKQALIFLSNRVHPTDNREAYIQRREEIICQYLAEKDYVDMV